MWLYVGSLFWPSYAVNCLVIPQIYFLNPLGNTICLFALLLMQSIHLICSLYCCNTASPFLSGCLFFFGDRVWRAYRVGIKASESYQKETGSPWLSRFATDWYQVCWRTHYAFVQWLTEYVCVYKKYVSMYKVCVCMCSQKQAGHRGKATARPLITQANRAAADSLPCQSDSQRDGEARAGHVKH